MSSMTGITATFTGRLLADPSTGTNPKTGKPWWSCRCSCGDVDDAGETVQVGVRYWGVIEGLKRGDLISVSGRLRLRTFERAKGEPPQVGLVVTAEAIKVVELAGGGKQGAASVPGRMGRV